MYNIIYHYILCAIVCYCISISMDIIIRTLENYYDWDARDDDKHTQCSERILVLSLLFSGSAACHRPRAVNAKQVNCCVIMSLKSLFFHSDA